MKYALLQSSRKKYTTFEVHVIFMNIYVVRTFKFREHK